WRQQRREGHAIPCPRRRLELSRRRITSRRLQDGLGEDIFPRGIDQPALAGAEVGGAAALRMSGGDLVLGSMGLLGKRVAVGKPIGPGDAARPVVIVKRLDP